MDRNTATDKLRDLAVRLLETEWLVGVIEELYVFGSYARGLAQVGDVDVDVEVNLASPATFKLLDEGRHAALVPLLQAYDPEISVAVNFSSRFPAVSPDIRLLYRRGETLATVLARIDEIAPATPDASAETQDFVLPALVGLERAIDRTGRQLICLLVERGALRVARGDAATVSLPATAPAVEVLRSLRDHEQVLWLIGSPPLLLTGGPVFAVELDRALTEMNLIWHELFAR